MGGDGERWTDSRDTLKLELKGILDGLHEVLQRY